MPPFLLEFPWSELAAVEEVCVEVASIGLFLSLDAEGALELATMLLVAGAIIVVLCAALAEAESVAIEVHSDGAAAGNVSDASVPSQPPSPQHCHTCASESH